MLSLDPGFAPGTGPRRLTRASPCVDSGPDAGTPTVDFEGDPRPADGDGDGISIADMGADELPAGALFGDGFESGSTSSWSLSVPDRP